MGGFVKGKGKGGFVKGGKGKATGTIRVAVPSYTTKTVSIKGAKGAKGVVGAGKGALKGYGGKGSAGGLVIKHTIKQASPTISWRPSGTIRAVTVTGKASKGTAGKGTLKGASKGAGKAVYATSSKSYGKGGGSFGKKGGKGKGVVFVKGKGKGKPAPPANSPYWKEKELAEEREALEGQFSGVVASYNFRAGWGFIRPDSPEILPDKAKEKLAEAQAQAAAEGKSSDEQLLYFRKPDITTGFKVEKEGAVQFKVYVDNKGAGAFEVGGIEQ